MARKQKNAGPGVPVYALPAVGTCLTVLSGLSFLWVCMLLPLVGQAGAATRFAAANRHAFAFYVTLSFVLSVLAILSKSARRAIDGSPRPLSSYALCVVDVLLLICLFTGLLAI